MNVGFIFLESVVNNFISLKSRDFNTLNLQLGVITNPFDTLQIKV